MSDKPKRWTWEELSKEFKEDVLLLEGWEANEPYIEWLEERNQARLDAIIKLGDAGVKLEAENASLTARIEDLEEKDSQSIRRQAITNERVRKLREALELIRDCAFEDGTVNTAKQVLKECFGEDND